MLSNLFYRHPRLTVLAVGFILVAGFSALNSLSRQEDPVLTGRFASIETYFPSGSAARVETLVTEKIENALEVIEEIEEITSISRTGVSIIEIELQDTVTNVDEVWSRVRDKLTDVQPELPQSAGMPEFSRQLPTAHTFLVGFTWEVDDQPQTDLLYRLAKEFEQRLAPLPGTQETELFGVPEEEILVTIDPLVLASANLTAAEVSRAIAQADAKVPAGQLRSGRNNLIIELSGELDSMERIRGIPLRQEDDSRFLRVGDVARVEKTLRQPPATLALVNGQVGIVVGARMETDHRIDRWAANARAVFERFSGTLSEGVRAEVIFDQSVYMRARLGNLVQNLASGVIIVVAVLFVMMGWKSALLVAASLPLSVAMVLAGLNLLGIPLQQISITGLIIALGLLIDNAIISVDEYHRERRSGLEPINAIAASVKRLFVPLLASTATTALTFMPIVLIPGDTGEFVGSMGVAVILSIFSSLFLTLTVIPALAGFFDRPATGKATFWRHGISHPALAGVYRRLLDAVLKRPWTGILVGAALPILGFVLSIQLTEQFFPPVDRSQFQIHIQLPPQSSLAETRLSVEQARAILHTHPDVVSSHWFIGESPPRVYYNAITRQAGVSSFAGAFVNTTSPAATRVLLPDLQRELMDALPNAIVLTLPFEQGPPFEAPVELHVTGPDLDALQRLGEQLRAIVDQSPLVTFTQAKITGGLPKLNLVPDEDEASLAGFQLVGLARQLNADLEGTTGGTVLENTEELPVRVRVDREDRSKLARISANILLAPARNSSSLENTVPGAPLSVLTRVELVPEVNAIIHRQGVRTNTIQAYVEPFTLPGITLADIRRRLAEQPFQLPSGYELGYGGETKERAESQGGLQSAMGPLIILIIGILVLAFNSFRMAAIIGLVAVQSMGLALLALWVFGYPMGFMAILGVMGLVGLAINDSIVVLSALNGDPRAREAKLAAIREVVMGSTRHVMSTTLTTVGGFLPLILFGGTFWPPLATTIVGGLIGATVLALFFVPAVFIYVVRRDVRRSRRARVAFEGNNVAGAVVTDS